VFLMCAKTLLPSTDTSPTNLFNLLKNFAGINSGNFIFTKAPPGGGANKFGEGGGGSF